MSHRPRFDCLWCGAQHAPRSPADLEGWAQLCPDCLGRAGDNAFLRRRLRAALVERAAATEPPPAVERAAATEPPPAAATEPPPAVERAAASEPPDEPGAHG